MTEIKNCITTLPLLVADNPAPLGKIISPLFMDMISKKLGISKILALNLISHRFYGVSPQVVEETTDKYLDTLGCMDIQPDFVWRDNDPQNMEHIQGFFNRLFDEGWISQSEKEIERCECGIIEGLTGIESISQRRTLFYYSDQRKLCKVCKTEVKQFKETVCLFRFPEVSSYIEAYPSFYKKELIVMAQKFSGKDFLISKNRKTSFQILIRNGSRVSIDVDFVWQMFLSLLPCYGYKPTILVGNRRNLLAFIFSIALYKLIDNRKVLVVIHPYFLPKEGKVLTGEQYSVDELLKSYSNKSIRLFLSTATNWKRKESKLNFDMLKLIEKMSYRIYSRQRSYDNVTIAAEDLDGNRIKQILKEARGQKTGVEKEELWGII